MTQFALSSGRDDFEEKSGVRKRIYPSMTFNKEVNNSRFEDMLFQMEEDPYLKSLLMVKNSIQGRQVGVLNFAIGRLRTIQDKYLIAEKGFANKEGQQADLSLLYKAIMENVVKNWSQIAATGLPWSDLCLRVELHVLQIATIFGVEKGVAQYIDNWFRGYRRDQAEQAEYRKRDALNAEALGLHQNLAFQQSQGNLSRELVNQTRNRLAEIDKELLNLKVAPEALPAFSKTAKVVDSVVKPAQAEVPKQAPSFALPKEQVPEKPKGFFKRIFGGLFR